MVICTIERINKSYAQIDIMFKRKFEYHLSNTFLSTLLLLIISFMTFFFEVDNFTDKIMVVLTTMLVIATLQSTTQQVQRQAKYNCKSHSKLYCRLFQSLPKTAYFKLIDFWFLFSLNVFILTFMFHTFVGYLHGRLNAQDEDGKKRSSNFSNKMQGLISMMSRKKNSKQNTIDVNGKEKVCNLFIAIAQYVTNMKAVGIFMNNCSYTLCKNP